MAELSRFYVQRQLARPSPGGRGGGGGGAVPQPRVPDVSGIFAPMAGIGQELDESAQYLGQVVAKQRKARDIATLTEFETGFDEAVGMKAAEIENDRRIHPDDWAPMLIAYREDLFKERSQGLRSDLQPLAKARAYKGTERTVIDAKAKGAALANKRALEVLDVYEEHISGKMLTESNEGQYKMLQDQLKQKYAEYEEAGYLSADDRFLREHKAGQRLLEAGITMDAQMDGKGTLERLMKGEYAGLSAEARVKLVDKAQAERREQAEWQDQEDRRAERKVAEQQAMTSSSLRDRIYAMGGGPGAIRLISDARSSREISEGDHSTLMNFAIALQNHRASMAASAASRAAAEASRAEIAQRRKDENTTGLLTARYLDGRPGPDGQIITSSSIMDMATSGKLNGHVAGQVATRVSAHERMLQETASGEVKQKFSGAIQTAEAIFEQSGLSPSKTQGAQQAWAAFREDLTSKVFRDGMDPYEASDKILNRYVGEAAAGLSQRQKVIINTLPHQYRPSPDEGIESAVKKLKQDYDAHNSPMTEGDFKMHMRRLKELETYPDFKTGAAQRRSASEGTGATQAPTEAQAPPGFFQRFKSLLPALNTPEKRTP